ncbi:EAL domain-containing protein [Ideonella sp.]|uniref:EAL domain-containing protein n=1 Tax=Ideonella sp. TaxID=1929293 RepID=UPI0035B2B7B1
MTPRCPPAPAGRQVASARATGPWPAHVHAFQPIVDTHRQCVFSYEALLRAADGRSPVELFDSLPPADRHRFDEITRQSAIAAAARLDLACHLNVNCLPCGLLEDPALLDRTLIEAARHGWSADRLIIEMTESEVIDDPTRFAGIFDHYRARGLRVAIDDFGAGYSGLNLLAAFQPDQVKIDMNLVRGIEGHGPRQAIVRAIMQCCTDLGIDVIAEGVETMAEYTWFAAEGVRLYQGWLFGRPAVGALRAPTWPR